MHWQIITIQCEACTARAHGFQMLVEKSGGEILG